MLVSPMTDAMRVAVVTAIGALSGILLAIGLVWSGPDAVRTLVWFPGHETARLLLRSTTFRDWMGLAPIGRHTNAGIAISIAVCLLFWGGLFGILSHRAYSQYLRGQTPEP